MTTLWRSLKEYRAKDPVGVLVRLVIFLLGLLALVASQLVEKSSVYSFTLASAGAALATFGIAASINALFDVDSATQTREVLTRLTALGVSLERAGVAPGLSRLHSGVVGVDPDLARDDNPEFKSFSRAMTIDLLYNTGKTTVRSYGDNICAALRKGATVRVLVSDPAGPVAHPAVAAGLCPGTNIVEEVREVIETIGRWIIEIESESGIRPKIDLRLLNCVPTFSLVVVDDRWARVVPYLPFVHSQVSPILHLDSDDGFMFDKYKDTFERMWKKSAAVA